MTTQFNSLLQCVSYYHCELDELIILHQEALVTQQIELAKHALQLFAKFLSSHLDLEDELLIPAHDQLTMDKTWRTLIYREEHKKLRELLSNVQKMLDKQPESGQQRRWIIELIDYERTFKNVMEHHEEREEKGLLLELDNHLEKEELHTLITKCHLKWQEMNDTIADDVSDIKQQLG